MKNSFFIFAIFLLHSCAAVLPADTVTLTRATGETETATVPNGIQYVVASWPGGSATLRAATVPATTRPALRAEVGDPVWLDFGTHPGRSDFGDGTATTRPTYVDGHAYAGPGTYSASFGTVLVSDRSWQRVDAPAGANLAALIAAERGPTTISLAPGAAYAIPAGIPIRQATEVVGHGATLAAGNLGSTFGAYAPFYLSDLTFAGTTPLGANGKYSRDAIHPMAGQVVVCRNVTFAGVDDVVNGNLAPSGVLLENCSGLALGGNAVWGGGRNTVVRGGRWSSRNEPTFRFSEPSTNGFLVVGADITGTADGVKEPVSFRIGRRGAIIGNAVHGRIVIGEGAPAAGQTVAGCVVAANVYTNAPRPTTGPVGAANARGFLMIRAGIPPLTDIFDLP